MEGQGETINQDVPVFPYTPDFPYIPEIWREAELRKDPKVEKIMKLSDAWLHETDSSHNWGQLGKLKEVWKGPIVLKGIMDVRVRN